MLSPDEGGVAPEKIWYSYMTLLPEIKMILDSFIRSFIVLFFVILWFELLLGLQVEP